MLWNKFLAFFVGLKELRKHLVAENEKNVRAQTHESIRAIGFNGTKMMKKKKTRENKKVWLEFCCSSRARDAEPDTTGHNRNWKINKLQWSLSGANYRPKVKSWIVVIIHSVNVGLPDSRNVANEKKAIGTKRRPLRRWVTTYNRLIVTNWRLKSVGLVQNDLTSSGATLVCKVNFRLGFSCIHDFAVPHQKRSSEKEGSFQ